MLQIQTIALRPMTFTLRKVILTASSGRLTMQMQTLVVKIEACVYCKRNKPALISFPMNKPPFQNIYYLLTKFLRACVLLSQFIQFTV